MISDSIVNNHLWHSSILGHDSNNLKLVILRFFFVRHRLPFRVSTNLSHLITCTTITQHFTTKRRFLKQWINRHSTPGRVTVLIVVRTIISPFGSLVYNVFIYNSAFVVYTCQETFVGECKTRVTLFTFFTSSTSTINTF